MQKLFVLVCFSLRACTLVRIVQKTAHHIKWEIICHSGNFLWLSQRIKVFWWFYICVAFVTDGDDVGARLRLNVLSLPLIIRYLYDIVYIYIWIVRRSIIIRNFRRSLMSWDWNLSRVSFVHRNKESECLFSPMYEFCTNEFPLSPVIEMILNGDSQIVQ